MQSIRIKQEVVNSDDEDNKHLPPTAFFKNESMCEGDCSNHVKKEIVFDGLPKKLQIQLLPGALKDEVIEETTTVKSLSKAIIFTSQFA